MRSEEPWEVRWGRRVEAGEASTFEDRIQGPLLSLGTQTFRVSSSHAVNRLES